MAEALLETLIVFPDFVINRSLCVDCSFLFCIIFSIKLSSSFVEFSSRVNFNASLYFFPKISFSLKPEIFSAALLKIIIFKFLSITNTPSPMPYSIAFILSFSYSRSVSVSSMFLIIFRVSSFVFSSTLFLLDSSFVLSVTFFSNSLPDFMKQSAILLTALASSPISSFGNVCTRFFGFPLIISLATSIIFFRGFVITLKIIIYNIKNNVNRNSITVGSALA